MSNFTIHQKAALRRALTALELEKKRLNVQANLHEKLGADIPSAVRAYMERKRIREAERVIQEMLEGSE